MIMFGRVVVMEGQDLKFAWGYTRCNLRQSWMTGKMHVFGSLQRLPLCC